MSASGLINAIEEKRMVTRLQELVRVPSFTGSETEAIELVESWLRSINVDSITRVTDKTSELQKDPAYPGIEVPREDVPLIWATIKGKRPGPSMLLTGHIDVVPLGDEEKWTVEPFGGEVKDGRVYGRGTCDMKGGVVALLDVFQVFAESDRDFAGEITFCAVPGEEDGGCGTLACIRRGVKADYCIITEPTIGGAFHGGEDHDDGRGPSIITSHAGCITVMVEVAGRAAHASTRLKGECALEHFNKVLAAMREDERIVNEAESEPRMVALGLPYPTCVGKISGGDWASSVMDTIKAEVRVGVTMEETPAQAIERFRRNVLSHPIVRDDPWLQKNPPKMESVGQGFRSSTIPADHHLVNTLTEAAVDITGRSPRNVGCPYGCDMALWIQEGGTPTVVWGPGELRMAHSYDEFVSIEEMSMVARTITEACSRLLQ